MDETTTWHHPDTLAFYDREAATYAAKGAAEGQSLDAFLALLPAGAKILELGCGAGHDATAMIAAGFEVTPTDGSPGLAAQAEQRLGRPVRVMKFEELDEVAAYDAVWANACLLHVPDAGLDAVLGRVHRALKLGGLFYAGFKAGDGGDRDSLGRYYNFPSRERLDGAYDAAGPWSTRDVRVGQGGGYDGVARTWLHVMATKG